MKRTFLFSVLIFFFTIVGCEKNDKPEVKEEMKKGRIIGYLKCFEKNNRDNLLLGIYILSDDRKDSILVFNKIPSDVILALQNRRNGVYYWLEDSILFSYRLAKPNEQKNPECPPSLADVPNFDAFNYKQAIMINIEKRK